MPMWHAHQEHALTCGLAMHASHDMCHEAMHAWPWCGLGGGLYKPYWLGGEDTPTHHHPRAVSRLDGARGGIWRQSTATNDDVRESARKRVVRFGISAKLLGRCSEAADRTLQHRTSNSRSQLGWIKSRFFMNCVLLVINNNETTFNISSILLLY